MVICGAMAITFSLPLLSHIPVSSQFSCTKPHSGPTVWRCSMHFANHRGNDIPSLADLFLTAIAK